MLYAMCSHGGELPHRVYSVICYRLCYTACVVTGVSFSPGFFFCNLLEIMLYAVCGHGGEFFTRFSVTCYRLCYTPCVVTGGEFFTRVFL